MNANFGCIQIITGHNVWKNINVPTTCLKARVGGISPWTSDNQRQVVFKDACKIYKTACNICEAASGNVPCIHFSLSSRSTLHCSSCWSPSSSASSPLNVKRFSVSPSSKNVKFQTFNFTKIPSCWMLLAKNWFWRKRGNVSPFLNWMYVMGFSSISHYSPPNWSQ